jgi:hypothetical protein
MSRLITVDIKTVKDGQSVSGWEVFYKWDCASGFSPDELRFPILSSPARATLPPGQYSVYAQKLANGVVTKTAAIKVTAYGVPSITCEIAIP